MRTASELGCGRVLRGAQGRLSWAALPLSPAKDVPQEATHETALPFQAVSGDAGDGEVPADGSLPACCLRQAGECRSLIQGWRLLCLVQVKEQRDEDWSMSALVSSLCNRRRSERTVGYVESHDQSLVGDQTLGAAPLPCKHNASPAQAQGSDDVPGIYLCSQPVIT